MALIQAQVRGLQSYIRLQSRTDVRSPVPR
ncbi:hypothetical protein [Enterobacter sp. 22466]